MSTDRTLSSSTVTQVIGAPLELVNIADWRTHLSDAEYQRGSRADLAAGNSTIDDGRAMKINVETVGDALIVQHYVAEIREPHLCRLVSLSDYITAAGGPRFRSCGSCARGSSTTAPPSSAIISRGSQRTKRWLS